MGTKVYDNALDLITFTRASGGTALRKISYGSELVTNGTFDTDTTGWTNSGMATFEVQSGRLRITANANADSVYQDVTTTSGKVYLLTFGYEQVGGDSLFDGTGIQWTSGSITGTGSVSHVFVGTGTDRVQFSEGGVGNNADFYIDNVSVKEVFFDRPDGTLTLFNHPNNIPRIEYAANGTVKGLLIEEQRTNLVTYSNALDAWTVANTDSFTVTANQATGRDGEASLAKIAITDATNESHEIYKSFTGVAGSTYTLSVDAKYGTHPYWALRFWTAASNWTTVVFDLSSGQITQSSNGTGGTMVSSSIKPHGDVYRISMSAYTTSGTTMYITVDACSSATPTLSATTGTEAFAGTAGVYSYFGFAQVELGSFPTSYIPTSGATATRAEESALLTAKPFNAKAGTFVAEFSYSDPNNINANYVIGGSSSSRVIYNNSGSDVWQSYDGVSATSFSSVVGDGTSYKLGVSAKEGVSTTTYNNGTQTGTTSNSSLMSEVVASAYIAIGGGSASQMLNGHIKSIKYYPRRLTNAQLQELTS